MGEQERECVDLPVISSSGMWFHEAWFSGEVEGVGSVQVSNAIAPLILVSVQMEDGRSGRYALDIEEAVRELVERKFPSFRPDPQQEESDG